MHRPVSISLAFVYRKYTWVRRNDDVDGPWLARPAVAERAALDHDVAWTDVGGRLILLL
jgi:hypothetical protein